MPHFKELFGLLGLFSPHVVTEGDPEMARIAKLSFYRRGNLAKRCSEDKADICGER